MHLLAMCLTYTHSIRKTVRGIASMVEHEFFLPRQGLGVGGFAVGYRWMTATAKRAWHYAAVVAITSYAYTDSIGSLG